jgi:hypothetical protein
LDEHRHIMRLGSLGDMCFQLLDLRAAIKNGDMTTTAIRETAIRMDTDLETWKAKLQPNWSYTTVYDCDDSIYFKGIHQIYDNPWIAQAWNTWRTLRILINQIIFQNEIGSDELEVTEPTSISLIHRLSAEICISVPSFLGSPRKYASITKTFAADFVDYRFGLSHLAALSCV